MTPEHVAALSAPFTPDEIGLLPRITCRDCSDKNARCGEHKRQKCQQCKGFLTTAHIHLDYVGHADVTRRLLDVDPAWTWEPVDPAGTGLPAVSGGMWIKLTVCGVARYGFGDAAGKTGPNAVKEIIGDAIRNAAMRFGVGLELWAKGDRKWSAEGGARVDAENAATPPAPAAAQPVDDRTAEQVEADATRDEIRRFATGLGWDLAKVAAAFRREHHADLKTTTDVGTLVQFLGDIQVEAQAEQERKSGRAA